MKPSVGTATFFSYKGSDGRMDDGYTEHSGCPVLDGEKVSDNDDDDDYDDDYDDDDAMYKL